MVVSEVDTTSTDLGQHSRVSDENESSYLAHHPGGAFTRSTTGTSGTRLAEGAAIDSKGKAAETVLQLRRTSTISSEGYVPIITSDESVLRKLATHTLQLIQPLSMNDSGGIRRQDTLDDIHIGDAVLNPSSPEFDLNKWIRMRMRALDLDGIKVKRAGICFTNLSVSGNGTAVNLQSDVGGFFMARLRLNEYFHVGKKPVKQILRNFDGLLRSGEMLMVLGRPDSGCSTLLKAITGELHGLDLEDGSIVHYNGISQHQMLKEFKGEVVYNTEQDQHFPHLTVGQTLEHAAALRTPSHRAQGVDRKDSIKHITKVVMAVYGLSHTYNTKVGNDFVRGVSGGERKRCSIAEMALSGSPLAAWDNSTRGLDSATALEFTKSLRQSANLVGSVHAVALYQASQAIYDLFDKVIVLYEGREIFFGRTDRAKAYFEEMGFHCPQRLTTGDFGYENRVPRTPDDFDAYWRRSNDYKALRREIDEHTEDFGNGGEQLAAFRSSKHDAQAKHMRAKSPYIVSVPMQIKLNTKRAYQRLWNDKASTIATVLSQVAMSLIVGSAYYNTPSATAGFFSLGAVLFFAILFNALIAISEISSLYAQRPIVQKHQSWALYRPSTEAIAGIIADIPVKFCIAVTFNVILYFMSGLRREPSQFFIFFLVAFISVFVMSTIFRTIAALTRTVAQAISISGILVLVIAVYTGFIVPIPYMHPWFSWIRFINPIFYAFEILIANEFHGQNFTCSAFIPAYTPLPGESFICSMTGAIAGQRTVSGDDFIASMYSYYYSHVWRNLGILLAFLVGFMIANFVAVELNSSTTSGAEFLVFRRGHAPSHTGDLGKKQANDEEVAISPSGESTEKEEHDINVVVVTSERSIFTWRDVKYNIPVKEGTRTLLDNVSGWAKPGTLTALMGTSGAGKTTLLDTLAQRTTTGVVTGDMFVNGRPLDSSFQRRTGYAQQQDLHLETATVRESLRFSARLRQPSNVSRQAKDDHVEDVIKMLDMSEFADAIVGVPGSGLNVEQRKLLTIGVELAAKPTLLLFLDEPTSGLDSQSAWAICTFLRKLADSGQAVLCTIHQPSAVLFQQFDRLLFLRQGGQTVYFGDIGKDSHSLLEYFEKKGARKCDVTENPAEYMLEVVANKDHHDWNSIWQNSQEAKDIQTEMDRIYEQDQSTENADSTAHGEFAAPFSQQLGEVTLRVFQQYWRLPLYVLAKFTLGLVSGLFIGFSFFNANLTQQGTQNVIFSIFMVSTIFSSLVQSIMPLFVTQRLLYEVRERPSKAYSWKAFLFANIVVEIPYQTFTAILVFACLYYPVVGVQSSERQGLVLLFTIEFFIYASSFAHLLIAALPDARTAGSVATALFAMTLVFNGVMQPPNALPGFWTFMFRISPLTYWISGMASTMLHGRPIECSPSEASTFDPPVGQTCQQYLAAYLSTAPGTLKNPDASSQCRYCSLSNADQLLAISGIAWSDRWRNLGLMWVYICFNICGAVVLYYIFRVRGMSLKPSGRIIRILGKIAKGLFAR